MRHVTELERNLISFCWLDSFDYDYFARSAIMQVSKDALEVMKGEKLLKNFDKLFCNTVNGGANDGGKPMEEHLLKITSKKR